MYKLKKFLKKLFTNTFFIILLISIGFVLFIKRDWVMKQVNKVQGIYYVYKGDKEYRKAKLQKAIDYYQRALVLYPEHYEAWFNLGNIYVVYEDYYSASDAYENAIKYNKKYTLAKMNLGIISAEKLGDFDGAISQYESIVNTNKRLIYIPFIFSNKRSEKINRGIAYYNMGLAYRQKSMYLSDEERIHTTQLLLNAIESYKNALKILRRDYDARYNLALTYHILGDYNEAGRNYCKAIELQPMSYEAHYNLAILLKHLKKYKDSLEELQKATLIVTTGSESSAKSIYIFGILNEVSSLMAITGEEEELFDLGPDKITETPLKIVRGKIVAAEDSEKILYKNLRTCGSSYLFK